jgi:hypothetical protein
MVHGAYTIDYGINIISITSYESKNPIGGR